MTTKSKSSLFKDITSVFVTKVFVLSLGLISAVLVARALGPEGRGLLAAVLIYPQLLVALTEGGMRQAAVFFIGKKKATDAQIMGSLFSYIIVAGSLGTVAVYSLMKFFGPANFSDIMLLVAAAILPLTLTVNALKGIFLGKQKINKFNQTSWVQKILYVTGIGLLYLLDELTVFSAIVVTTLASLFNLVQAIVYLRRNELFSFSFDINVFKSMFKLGIVFAIALFFIDANYKIDILLLSWLSTPESLGQYAVAVQLGELLWQLPAAVLVVLMSKSANSQGNEIVKSVCKTTRLTLLITFLSCIGLLTVSYFAIEPVFGKGFEGSFAILFMLSTGLILASVFKSINAYFAGQGKPRYTIYLMGFAVSINVILNIILIPKYHGLGAAFASTISYSISAIGAVIIFVKIENVKITEILFCKINDFKPILQKFSRTVD